MTGTWKGYYKYDKQKAQKAMGFDKINFTIFINSFDGKHLKELFSQCFGYSFSLIFHHSSCVHTIFINSFSIELTVGLKYINCQHSGKPYRYIVWNIP